MKLPDHPRGGVQIGISDILAWRDCPARAKLGRRRLEGKEAPETWSPENAYGSAIHHCIARLDEGATPSEAAQEAMARWPQWLEPADVTRLHEDMWKYLEREIVGVRTLLNEGEISVPLFEHPTVGRVWFRARIDRLVQSLDSPSELVHVDYKSSKWPKSHEQVAKDLQLWSYNWSIVEWFLDTYPEVDPELVHLQQLYDQLLYGQIPTSKGPAQRAEIKRWLIDVVTAMIEDQEEAPTFNEWCPWCSLKMDCPVVQFELTDWALARIAALMPRPPKLKKDGTPGKRQGKVQLDPERIREYAELLPDIKRAAKVLKDFNEEVTGVMKRLSDADLAGMGKRKVERSTRAFSAEAKRAIIEEVGLGTFLLMCDLSMAGVERFFEGEPDRAKEITALAETQPGGATLVVDL